jgi:CRP/FNR family transcriptional regulator, cyclic AMP receptor protein
MAKISQFQTGDVLFRQGDASDHVLRVTTGLVDVLRETEGGAILLGQVRPGEWLGEMGVVESRPRSATARAAAGGEVEMLPAQEFLERVSSEPALARDLILRLSMRLRSVEDRIAGGPSPLAAAADAAPIGVDAAISIAAETEPLRARIGAAPIRVGKLPFLVGRVPLGDEPQPVHHPDLAIADREPFRLSRQHFMIARHGDRLIVSDLGSTLGTIVNGQPIGHHFAQDSVALRRGANRILAGGEGSPFDFLVTVG